VTDRERGAVVHHAQRRTVFAPNSEPARPRPARRRFPPLGHGDQAFALRLFPRRLARAANRFGFLAGLALGWFFIRLAALQLTKNALALHLFLEDFESLIDIVVANEYLQNVFQSAGGAGRAAKLSMKLSRSARFDILRRLLAAVADQFVFDRLTLVE
jgi:hypothetical protein